MLCTIAELQAHVAAADHALPMLPARGAVCVVLRAWGRCRGSEHMVAPADSPNWLCAAYDFCFCDYIFDDMQEAEQSLGQ